MKHSFFILLASVLLLGACGKGNENHYTDIIYPSTRYRMVMADQTADSLVFASTDSWTLSNTGEAWCSYPKEFASFTNKYTNTWVVTSVQLTFTPNTTGKLRSALIKIDGGESSNAAYYSQVTFLGISRPLRTVNSNDLSVVSTQPLTLKATTTRDSVSFNAYGDWTLKALGGTWLAPIATEGAPGRKLVELTVEPNSLAAERRDTLLLISNGVQDSIFVIQEGLKQTED